MSILAALTTVLLFSGPAVAQLNYPSCVGTAWDWTYNSLNQNPCEVAVYLHTTCAQGPFTIPALPPGYEYSDPSANAGNMLCACNTVAYSLLSACGACQGEDWITWPQWISNCTTVLPPSTFPYPVPAGTRVPQWALRDASRDPLSLWDAVASLGVGDSPEIGPGGLIGISSSTTGGPTPSTSPNPTTFPETTSSPLLPPTPSPSYNDSSSSGSGGSSSSGAIIGAVVGSISAIGLIILVSIYMRKSRSTPSSTALVVGDVEQPPQEDQKPLPDDGSHASSSTPQTLTPPMMLYSPNGSSHPIVYPEYQEAPSPRAPDASSQPAESFLAYKLTNIPTSEPGEYHGLPIV